MERYAREAAVARELQQRGIAADYWHSGGGIFTIHIVTGDHVWDFGAEDHDTWGWDYSHQVNGHMVSGDLGIPTTAMATVTADAISARIAVDPYDSQQLMIDLVAMINDTVTTPGQTDGPFAEYMYPGFIMLNLGHDQGLGLDDEDDDNGWRYVLHHSVGDGEQTSSPLIDPASGLQLGTNGQPVSIDILFHAFMAVYHQREVLFH